jgi:ketopantoate hydroxymethyltransferase
MFCQTTEAKEAKGAFGDAPNLCKVGHFSVYLEFVINSITEEAFGALCIFQLCKQYRKKS